MSNLKERAKQLKIDIPAIFLALKDKRTPLLAKILSGIAIAYALSPIDLIPDFIPVFGYLDDLIIVPALITIIIKLIPNDLMNEYREYSKGMWQNGKPKKWYFALPIVLIWMVIILLIMRAIWFK